MVASYQKTPVVVEVIGDAIEELHLVGVVRLMVHVELTVLEKAAVLSSSVVRS